MMRGTNIWLPGWFSSLGWLALRLMMFFVTWKLIFSTAGSQEVLPFFGGPACYCAGWFIWSYATPRNVLLTTREE
ncbi:hypothetical protein KFK09_023148 [Dendrobium nobile]|uniref:Uncharacterized protein n=1 Tax=Dendrobium nobile TaxID=94219 RepID=A0A8T3ALA8_DENNO|nr:hypothetical protein KFK09_023148 [Dendrobium nobile]